MTDLDRVPELDPDVWHEECSDCPTDGEGCCLTCFDSGLIPHGHLIDAEVTA